MTDTTTTVESESTDTGTTVDTVVTTETTEPVTQVDEATTETIDISLTDEELEEIAKQFAQPVTEPTFFPWDKESNDEDKLTEVFAQMDALIESEVKKEALIKEKDDSLVQATSELATLKAELDDKNQFVETFQDFYTKLNAVLDTETIDKIWEGDLSWVPAHIVPENWKRVEENKFIYPYVEKLLKWEDVDIPKMIVELVNSKKASLPKPSSPSVQAEEVKPVSAMAAIVGGLRKRNWLN